MGLNTEYLGPHDQVIIKKMELAVLATLRMSSVHINKDTELSQAWFGDSHPSWIANLQRILNRMASIINLHTIKIHGTYFIQHDSKTIAGAEPPAHGWRNYLRNGAGVSFITGSQNEKFHMRLAVLWNTAPEYSIPYYSSYPKEPMYPMDCIKPNRKSKFNIIVHELSHLVMNTLDLQYGYHECLAFALQSPDGAKINADSWSYFLEEVWEIYHSC